MTEEQLFFARNFQTKVEFLNVSEALDLEVSAGSMVAMGTKEQVYLVTPENITLLDCSGEFED